MTVNTDWEVKFRTVWENHWHGSAVVTFYDSFADVMVDYAESGGHFQFALQSTELKLDHFKLKLHGGESWFVNFFKVFIVAALKDILGHEFNEGAGKVVERVNDIAMTVPLSLPLEVDDLAMNISLTTVPSVPGSGGYSSFPLQGNVFSTSDTNNSWPPFSVGTALPTLQTSDEIQLFVHSYVLDSSAWTLFELGQLVTHVSGLNTVDVAVGLTGGQAL
jgi:hypothetical protein